VGRRAAVGILVALAIGACSRRDRSSGAAGEASAEPAAPPSAAAGAVTKAARLTECPGDMTLVAGGRFMMGSNDSSYSLWQPAHPVTVDTVCIDRDEVTADKYKTCVDKGACGRPDPVPSYPKSAGTSDEDHERYRQAYAEMCNFGKEGRGDHPINCVTWAMADAYCKAQGRRLPTEAEWEYAARGRDSRKYPWGEERGDARHMNGCGAECARWQKEKGVPMTPQMYEADDGFVGTAPVGRFPEGKTKLGANDFVGNVWEWTADWYETYKPEEVVNPKGALAGDRKAIRGGDFNGGTDHCLNPAYRHHQLATASSHGIGFRCAMDL